MLRHAAKGLLAPLLQAAEGSALQQGFGLVGSSLLQQEVTQQVRQASNQAVKQRIRAIKNIGKITKAMKMVAASKMRNAQAAVETSRGIVNPFVRLFGDHPGLYQLDHLLAVECVVNPHWQTPSRALGLCFCRHHSTKVPDRSNHIRPWPLRWPQL
jgi:hypothetical protein